jgi:hypothetical protein
VEAAQRSITSDGVRTDTQRLDLSHVVDQEINVLAQRRPNPISVTPVVDGIAGSPWQIRACCGGPRVRASDW